MKLRGIKYLQRQDQANGRMATAEVYVSLSRENWGQPAAEINGQNSTGLETVRFGKPSVGRFLRLIVKSEVSGQPFAALAELDVITADPEK